VRAESEQLKKYLPRVGTKTKDRLKWVLQKVADYRRDSGADWSPGDWENACLEIAVFTGIKNLPGHGGIPMTDGKIDHPSQNEAKTILIIFQGMIEDALHHKSITLGEFHTKREIFWSQQAGRYFLWEDIEDATWQAKARYAMALLLKEDGHRLQRCPAKLAHSGKPCRKLFLKAKRGKYCSRQCASREMTRKFREK
jgi:hypothetical protein